MERTVTGLRQDARTDTAIAVSWPAVTDRRYQGKFCQDVIATIYPTLSPRSQNYVIYIRDCPPGQASETTCGAAAHVRSRTLPPGHADRPYNY